MRYSERRLPIGTKVKVEFTKTELHGIVGQVSGHANKLSFFPEPDDTSDTLLHIVRCESGFGSFLMHVDSLVELE